MAGTPHVLIVDDEPDILEALREAWQLEAPEVEVSTATSGAQALESIKASKPQLVLVDYKMPAMNGIEFVRQLRETHPDIPCIMMSAYSFPGLAQKAQASGMQLTVAKPLDMEFLIAGINRILLKRVAA